MFDTKFYEDKVPAHLLSGLIAWGKKHHTVGDFLTAVLTHDLWETVARADDESMNSLRHIVMFVHNELPGKCHGDKNTVAEWANLIEREMEKNWEDDEE